MRLESFRVQNFRSINDSGDIDVSQITALLGRNESGKSNILKALHSLNPASGFEELKSIKNFPRHRRLDECNDETQVVSSVWTLSDGDKAELSAILPRAASVERITIGRSYKSRSVGFFSLEPIAFSETDIKAKVRKIVPAIKAKADSLPEPHKTNLEKASDAFEENLVVTSDRVAWATSTKGAVLALRKSIAASGAELADMTDRILVELQELAESIVGDVDAQAKAKKWVVDNMPTFIYLEEYAELSGHQNVSEYITKKSQNTLRDSDKNFGKLCKVAGLDPVKLHELLSQNDAETRNQLANRASAVVTSEIRRLWKDRPLKVRFNLDSHHLDTLISDPNATFDVEVNLEERSRGFQWFFSFYITFAADTKAGHAEDAILLLDEPGLYLHAKSQSDLLRHFKDDFNNQIIFTTHSPYMVPTTNIECVRTVSIDEKLGTTVTNDPSGDSRTLFPLQAALGYHLSQSLFIGPSNLVVEGVTDYWILSSVSAYLSESNKTSLSPDLTITPAGGAQKVSYMVALLSSEELNVLVLLDGEKDAEATKEEIVKSKLISERNITIVTEGFSAPEPKEADIEDLLDPQLYEELVRDSYKSELIGKTLALNAKIPRVAKRVEAAFKDIGLAFHKTRPAKLFMQRMATKASSCLSADSVTRFETLFRIINGRLDRISSRNDKPFAGV